MKKVSRAVEYTLGEIIIVAIGLFIGFQFDSWKNDWQDRQDQKTILRSIASDLDRDTSLLLATAAEARKAASSAAYLLAQLDEDTPAAIDSVGPILQPLFSYIDVPLNAASFDLFTNSGKISLIQDASLERMLHSYYQRIASIYNTWQEWDRNWSTTELSGLRQLSFDRKASIAAADFQVGPDFWVKLGQNEALQSLLFVTQQTQEAMANAMDQILKQNRRLAASLADIL